LCRFYFTMNLWIKIIVLCGTSVDINKQKCRFEESHKCQRSNLVKIMFVQNPTLLWIEEKGHNLELVNINVRVNKLAMYAQLLMHNKCMQFHCCESVKFYITQANTCSTSYKQSAWLLLFNYSPSGYSNGIFYSQTKFFIAQRFCYSYLFFLKGKYQYGYDIIIIIRKHRKNTSGWFYNKQISCAAIF